MPRSRPRAESQPWPLVSLAFLAAVLGCQASAGFEVRLPGNTGLDLAVVAVVDASDPSLPVLAHSGLLPVEVAMATLGFEVSRSTEVHVVALLYDSDQLSADLQVPSTELTSLVSISLTGGTALPAPGAGGGWISASYRPAALPDTVSMAEAISAVDVEAVARANAQLRAIVSMLPADGGPDSGDIDSGPDSGPMLPAADVYVDDDAGPGGDGSATAPLDDIVAAAALCDGIAATVIYLFPGTYAPVTLPAGCSVIGAGMGQSIIDGGGLFRPVTIADTGPFGSFLSDVTLRNGAGVNLAGGLRVMAGASFVLMRVSVEDNASNQAGGGARLDNIGSLVIEDCVFTGNTALAFGGGGISMHNVASATISGTTISNNSCPGHGGGVRVVDSSVMFDSAAVLANNAGAQGGGVSLEDSTVAFVDSDIVGNVAASNAGGLAVHTAGSSLTVTRCELSLNEAGASGGGIYVEAGTVAVTNTWIVSNTSTASFGSGVGGGMTVAGSGSATLDFVTIANNASWGTATNSVGGLVCGGTTDVIGSIFWNNMPGPTATAPDADGSCNVTFSNVPGAPDVGLSNISVDPMFVDAAAGDYHLLPGSQCRDAVLSVVGPTDDIDGDPRDDGFADFGADEVVASP